ncbi:hypothetical protein FHX57_007778 [Paraburkholderia tropica]|uniref:Uncharacterized protein n=1 Tax=Paraburkholderia tropica TaxID=92647 RepID=A0AAQ1GPN0_9BURK|nr:hypothetical protein [Paraburkholderia tropica]MBB6324378.1 hypothetical protein [Paraburkholderia tropica]SEK15260.1 hypothetical protein SAMN05216550_1369 [Paraburkholderia tropica]
MQTMSETTLKAFLIDNGNGRFVAEPVVYIAPPPQSAPLRVGYAPSSEPVAALRR